MLINLIFPAYRLPACLGFYKARATYPKPHEA